MRGILFVRAVVLEQTVVIRASENFRHADVHVCQNRRIVDRELVLEIVQGRTPTRSITRSRSLWYQPLLVIGLSADLADRAEAKMR
jgi:hypothetical protein